MLTADYQLESVERPKSHVCNQKIRWLFSKDPSGLLKRPGGHDVEPFVCEQLREPHAGHAVVVDNENRSHGRAPRGVDTAPVAWCSVCQNGAIRDSIHFPYACLHGHRPPCPGPAIPEMGGGKRQLLGELRRFIPADFGAYHEPFLGSGAVFLTSGVVGRSPAGHAD